METTEQVANPPQPAATTPASSEVTSELERHASFLGVRPPIEVTAEDPDTSPARETDGADGQLGAAPATAEGDEQDDPSWLPDEQQKVFTTMPSRVMTNATATRRSRLSRILSESCYMGYSSSSPC